MADHLPRILGTAHDESYIDEIFLDERIMQVMKITVTLEPDLPWYADLANFLASGYIHKDYDPNRRRRLLAESRHYL